MSEWLRQGMMNLLVDYYPEVPFRPYGSGVSREEVLPFLRELRLGYLCIYAKGHGGHTSWPSSLATRHPLLGQDLPRLFRDLTREAGTRLVLYYSGLIDGLAGARHPDWRMHRLDGSDLRMLSDFGFFEAWALCPQSPYFDEWVTVHLRELLQHYEPDGIWVDGDWPGPCYCPRCQDRFRAETGWTQPWDEMRARPDFPAAYLTVWNRLTHEWRTRFRGFVKSIRPDCAYSAGNVNARREFAAPFDWRSGDFFSPGFFFLHDLARMMRWYGTLDVPFDAYVCDTSFTHARKPVRSRSKTLDRMLQEAATVAATGGQVGYWTYPNGDGAWVPSRLRKAVAVRQFLAERESLFIGSRHLPWTAILVSDPASPTFGAAAVEGVHKALAACHRSPALLDEDSLVEPIPYDLIVLPEQPVLSDTTAARLEAFVQAGGKLLTSGASIRSAALQRLLGVRLRQEGAFAEGHVFPRTAPFGEPTGIDSPWDCLDLDGAAELYPLYRSWDDDNPRAAELPGNWPMHGQVDERRPLPANCPAAVIRQLGRGTAIHLCTGVFAFYQRFGDPQLQRWLSEILDTLQPQPCCRTDAPSWVDLSLRLAADGRWLVHVVNQNPGRDVARLGSDDLWVDELPEVGPFTLALRLPAEPARATWEPGGQPLPMRCRDGVATLTVPRFRIHGCVAIAAG